MYDQSKKETQHNCVGASGHVYATAVILYIQLICSIRYSSGNIHIFTCNKYQAIRITQLELYLRCSLGLKHMYLHISIIYNINRSIDFPIRHNMY